MLARFKSFIKERRGISAIFLFLVLFVILMWLRGPEDDWICVDGQWAKHGYPSAPKPIGPCEKENWLGK